MKLISIVLPVYNGEKYLRTTLNSITNQTYKNFELIVVNDCSTDRTVEIVKEFMNNDSRIHLITNTKNQKLPKSLNTGFKKCKGCYFTWISDDNVLFPNMLETMVNKIEKENADLVFSRCETIDYNGKKIGETKIYNDLDELLYNNIVLASFLYKRNVHESLGGYDVSKFLVEDYDFWLRAYRKFKFAYIPEILYQIRFHENNLGHKRKEDVNIRKISLLKENIPYINDLKLKNCVYREISNCYLNASNVYYDKLTNDNQARRKMIKIRLKDVIKKVLKINEDGQNNG